MSEPATIAVASAREHGDGEEPTGTAAGLWAGDTGILSENSRRVLVQLIRGPYLSGDRNPGLWTALRSDQRAIESRLHELFLVLVIDPVAEFAFVRNVSTPDFEAPNTVRTQVLTFIDSAMVLVLRELLLAREGEGRVIVGRDEVFERLAVYRGADRDESDFERRLNSAWLKMREKLRVVHRVGRAADAEDRVEISPVLRLIVDGDQVRAIAAEYARLAGAAAKDMESADADVDDGLRDADINEDLEATDP